jgi:hypothetical protein
MNPTREIPQIVPVVLTQLARMRAAGELAADAFEEKIQRLCAEELAPRGLMLLSRQLSDGRIRFLIKDSMTHSLIHMLEYPSAGRRISATPRPWS